MTRIHFWFSGLEQPELDKTFFCFHPDVQGRTAFRTRFASLTSDYSGFRWTPALRALTVFFLQTAAQSLKVSCSGPIHLFEGGRGSLAASLDFALGKQSDWMNAIFGWDEDGNCLARRLIKRINPEGRRPGPFALFLKPDEMRPEDIAVYLNGNLVKDEQSLLRLCQRLSSQSFPKKNTSLMPSRCIDVTLPRRTISSSWLENIFMEEADRALSKMPLLLGPALKTSLDEVMNLPSFAKIAGSGRKRLAPLQGDHLSLNMIKNLHVEDFSPLSVYNDRPLRIALEVPNVGCLLIFYYLKNKLGLPIEVDFRFSLAVKILEAVRDRSILPDLLLLAAAPSSAFLGMDYCDYVPLSLMPQMSIGIVSGQGEKKSPLNEGIYTFYSDQPSGPSFLFSLLLERKLISRNRTKTFHSEPHEAAAILSESKGEVKSIQIFPYYRFQQIYSGADLERIMGTNPAGLSLMFVHKRLESPPQLQKLLRIAVYKAWYDLRMSRNTRQEMLRLLFSHDSYLDFLFTAAGISNASSGWDLRRKSAESIHAL